MNNLFADNSLVTQFPGSHSFRFEFLELILCGRFAGSRKISKRRRIISILMLTHSKK